MWDREGTDRNGPPAWVEVDLARIAHNVRTVKRALGAAALWAVVKAEGYGHGMLPAARTALAHGASGLAVATVAEARQLRAAGMAAPILLLNPPLPEEADACVSLALTSAVSHWENAAALSAAAIRAGRPVTVHVEIDTGMGRFGVRPEDAVTCFRALAELPALRVEGIFTHLATADEPDATFARQQLARFGEVLAALEAGGLRPPVRHAANSAAIFTLPESHFELARGGISLYGLCPSAHVASVARARGLELQPALSLKARVLAVRPLPAGAPVSYGRTYATPRATRIATLGIGYAAGVSRSLSNRLEVLLAGRRLPSVGRICMSQLMVDVGDAPVAPGDEAILIGEQGAERITADDWAALLGTINYEVTCLVGSCLPRRYR